jgi:large subunit ribosomal protein L23
MKAFHEVIRRPLVTEKSVMDRALSRYAFEVARTASKHAVREAVEKYFKVKVSKVRTMRVLGKRRRVGSSVGMSSDWKKAIVTLEKGQKIDVLEAE